MSRSSNSMIAHELANWFIVNDSPKRLILGTTEGCTNALRTHLPGDSSLEEPVGPEAALTGPVSSFEQEGWRYEPTTT